MGAKAIYRVSDLLRAGVALVALAGGDIVQIQDGRAGVVSGLRGVAVGEAFNLDLKGQFEVAKASGLNILSGGKVFWDRTNGVATFKSVAGGFYLGVASADAAASDGTVWVDLNTQPVYRANWRDGIWASALVGAATATRDAVGSRTAFAVIATSEAEKSDAFSAESVAIADGPILEARFALIANGSDATVDINVGLANATHATDADSITEHVLFHIDGGSLVINAQSKDGTTTVGATTTSLSAVVGTYAELWIDGRDPTNVKLYVDGVRVFDGTTGAATTFKLDKATGPLKALVHIEKTTGAATGSFAIESANLRSTDLA